MTVNTSFIHDRKYTQGAFLVGGVSQELVDVLQKVVQNVGALLDISNCFVTLLDAGGTTLVTLASLSEDGHKPRRTRFRLKEGIAGWVAEHRETLVINDVSRDTRFKRLGRMSIGSIVCVPLMHNGNFIGTLTASSQKIDAFDSKKSQMLTIFADQAVLAITNARNAELALRQTNQLEMLINLSRGITTRLESDALYRTILADVRCLVPCDLAVIYLYQDATQELNPVAQWSAADAVVDSQQEQSTDDIKTSDIQLEKINLSSLTAVAAWAAIHRHPILRPSVPNEQDLSLSTDIAELAIPFVSKDVLYGVLLLKRTEPFTSEELRLLRNLGNMAAAALENVELFYQVRSDQEELRAILTSSSDGIALLDENACFLEVNAAFGRIFDMEPQRVAGMECVELLGCDLEDGPQCCLEQCMIRKILQQGQAQPYIELDLRILEQARSIGVSITPVSTTSKPLCLFVARDVTVARDAARMKAKFLSMITHELRSPLNSINGYLDLALTGVAGELNEQQREFIQRARAGSEHLYALVEDLLIISRADSGQLRLSHEIVSLQEIVANAVEELELTALDNGVTILVDLAKDFPRLYADMVRLQQVLRNLLSNALHFTPSGGSITISACVEEQAVQGLVHAEENAPVVKLQVRDTGCGIATDHHTRIFERFYQVPRTATGRLSGQGLGLAIVKMIVELHGGSVMVESTPGQGSTFTCILPCLFS